VWMADTLEAARNLSSQAQQLRRSHGELGNEWIPSSLSEQALFVGDLVQVRSNQRDRAKTSRHVRNREVFTVVAIREDHLILRDAAGELVKVDREWAEENIELAYIRTIHAVQGVTAEKGGVLLSLGADYRAAYVGLTRGRQWNHAWVEVEEVGTSAEKALRDIVMRDRPDLGAAKQREYLERLAAARRKEELRLRHTLRRDEPPRRGPDLDFGF
jgi:ATP-dependent exoDNAse (exonuclease V) alpha subunit